MKTIGIIGLSCALLLGACKQSDPAPELEAAKLSVEQVLQLQNGTAPVHIFDANGDATRKKYGIVPGAKLLESSSSYDLTVLPASKDDKLVFYCSNTKCRAAEGAAGKALGAGYSDVNVMPGGIRGWTEAGNPVQKLN